MAAKIVTSEDIFFVKQPGVRKPDNVLSPPSKAIAAGECGFAYVISRTNAASARPLLVTPLLPGTQKFDPSPFNGKALVFRQDNSVTTCKILPDGRAIDSSGMDIFDTRQPYWGGVTPIVKSPDLPPYTPSPPPPRHDKTIFIVVGILTPMIAWAISRLWRKKKPLGLEPPTSAPLT